MLLFLNFGLERQFDRPRFHFGGHEPLPPHFIFVIDMIPHL